MRSSLALIGLVAGLSFGATAGDEAANWWSVQPISIKEGLVADPTGLSQNEIDPFVLAELREKNLALSPEAEPRVLCRRLYFDLTGLPPTPEQLNAFLKAHEADPESAFGKLVDQLLNSDAYGEKWARHWLDIAHYADTHGFERDKLRENAWRYRDYVIRSFNDDKPYDQFLREQIAGDVLAPDDPDSVVATGFLAAGPWDFVGQVETKSDVLRRSARALDLDDMVTQVMTATVGMTVNCARCHDHKIDPISQKEYYQLVSIFAGLKREDRVINEAALAKYEAEKKRVDDELKRVRFAIGEIRGDAIDLADIAGGGNGLGSGKFRQGLDVRSGAIQEREFGFLGNVKTNHFAPCKHHEFIDGVVIPDGGEKAEAKIPITSTGLTVTGIPKTSGQAWDMIRNGPVASQHSTELGGIDYAAGGHSLLGLHANAGITFDLAAIRKASKHGALKFSAVAGYGGKEGAMAAEFWIYLDGELQAHQRIDRKTGGVEIEFAVPESAGFLTLLSTDGGNGIGHDQIFFGDPKLSPAVPKGISEADRTKLTQLETQKSKLDAERKQLGSPPRVYGIVAEKEPPSVHILERGDPESPGETVTPATLSWIEPHLPAGIGDESMPEGERRLALANWVTDPKNPLTARVIVNRLWHWHFGQGLVTTPSDFGLAGGEPSHPDLLDFLAAKLIEEKWSLKAIHRLILNSATWRQSSAWREDAAAVDAQNRLFWRMNPRRLQAEEVRDAVLSITGNLNAQMFGPGYRDFDYKEAYAPIYTYQTPDSSKLWRRSIYRFVVRSTPHQFMTTMDCPDPANLTPKRLTTTTALQSLALYNNDFMLRQARYFAERIGKEKSAEEQIARAFQLALGREPRREELTAARKLVEEIGRFAFCRSLLNANEFVYVD